MPGIILRISLALISLMAGLTAHIFKTQVDPKEDKDQKE